MAEPGGEALPLESRTRTEQETLDLGVRLARLLRPGRVVLLEGPLGCGKTVLCRGIARGLGVDPARVRSPSFNILFTYQGRVPVHHIDLFRLDRGPQIVEAGVEEALWDEKAVSLVEWGERLGTLPLPAGLRVRIEGSGAEERRILVEER